MKKKPKNQVSTSIPDTATMDLPFTSAHPAPEPTKKTTEPLTVAKKRSFWDDDDDPAHEEAVTGDHNLKGSFIPKTKPVVIETDFEKIASGFEPDAGLIGDPAAPFIDLTGKPGISQHTLTKITTKAGSPVMIIDRIGKDWEDLFVYGWETKTVLHVHRNALIPVEAVNATIAVIEQLRK